MGRPEAKSPTQIVGREDTMIDAFEGDSAIQVGHEIFSSIGVYISGVEGRQVVLRAISLAFWCSEGLCNIHCGCGRNQKLSPILFFRSGAVGCSLWCAKSKARRPAGLVCEFWRYLLPAFYRPGVGILSR